MLQLAGLQERNASDQRNVVHQRTEIYNSVFISCGHSLGTKLYQSSKIYQSFEVGASIDATTFRMKEKVKTDDIQ